MRFTGKDVRLGGALLLLLFSAACGIAGQQSGSGQSAAEGADGASGQAAVRTIRDAGGEVAIPVKPLRIADVSGSTEELLVLGFTPVVTGNTEMSAPTQLTPILQKKLGGGTVKAGWFQSEVSLEAIAAANPDLILAGPAQSKIYDQLRTIAPTVRVPYGFNAFRERFSFLAETLDKKKEMEDWSSRYEADSRKLKEQITKLTGNETFAVIEATQKEIRVYAETGIADMLYRDLGLPKPPGTPDPDPWGGKVLSLEALPAIDADHIVLLADNEQNALEQSRLWGGLRAVKTGHVYRVTSRQSYNEAFFALGKENLIGQIAGDILEKNKR
ncbi:ABC transporter substrate-binding protein [Paenibacillus chitinolyticus]|uniref:ABC transporter substrate-binding protein n=1 Tax=Paenibacillus chitinolyticus TaxID=79263 RepID=UPI0035D59302